MRFIWNFIKIGTLAFMVGFMHFLFVFADVKFFGYLIAFAPYIIIGYLVIKKWLYKPFKKYIISLLDF